MHQTHGDVWPRGVSIGGNGRYFPQQLILQGQPALLRERGGHGRARRYITVAIERQQSLRQRDGRRLEQGASAIIRMHQLGNAADVGGNERDAFEDALQHGVWRILDQRGDDRDAAGLLQIIQRLIPIVIRQQGHHPGPVRQLVGDDRGGIKLRGDDGLAEKRDLHARAQVGRDLAQCIEKNEQAFVFAPADQRIPTR